LKTIFHVSAYAGKVRLEEWDSYPSRVCSEHPTGCWGCSRSTIAWRRFFVLGWVAEKKPEIVARVATAGHEIALPHSMLHRRNLRPDAARIPGRYAPREGPSLKMPRGKQVVGYRGPSFSVTRKSLWALEISGRRGISIRFEHLSSGTSFLLGFPTRRERRIGSIPPAGGSWNFLCRRCLLDR